MSQTEILAQLKAGTLTVEAAAKLLDAEDKPAKALSCKVSEKGAVSVYGLQRMPVTLYGTQWDRLIEFGPEILKFMEANRAKLTTKAPKVAA